MTSEISHRLFQAVLLATILRLVPSATGQTPPVCPDGWGGLVPLADYGEDPGFPPADDANFRAIQDIVNILATRVEHSWYLMPESIYFPDGDQRPTDLFWSTAETGGAGWVVVPHASAAMWPEASLGVVHDSTTSRPQLPALSLSESLCNWGVSGPPAPLSDASLLARMLGPSMSRCYGMNTSTGADSIVSGLGPRAHAGQWPRGIELAWGLSPGDYPPLSTSPIDSTSPLVPLQNRSAPGSAMYAERVVEGDSLDVLTGQPLLREVDFELPFGSAVFRHVRTYSELPRFAAYHAGGEFFGSSTSVVNKMNMWWSWHGSNWMISENPLFLIDAEYGGGEIAPFGPRRCYFVPDAHHAIPFELMEVGGGSPRYVAPPWFDADLTYEGGEWDSARKMWIDPPTRFYVRLFGGEITYEIRPNYEDTVRIPPQVSSGLEVGAMLEELGHETLVALKDTGVGGALVDKLGGAGIPHYGVVETIRDRAGNRVEITYDDGHAPKPHPLADGRYETSPVSQNDPPRPVHRYMQEGYRKGMIREVRLFPAGAEENDPPTWTLLYTYRTFLNAFDIRRRSSGDTDCHDDGDGLVLNESHFWDIYAVKPALHSIVAYRGQVERPDRDITLEACSVENGAAAGSPPFVELHQEYLNPGDPCELFMQPVVGGLATPFDYQDQTIGPAGEGADSSGWTMLPQHWSKIVQYSYSEPQDFSTHSAAGSDEPPYPPAASYYAASTGDLQDRDTSADDSAGARTEATQLLRVRAQHRVDPGQPGQPGPQDAMEQFWMYRYQDLREDQFDEFRMLNLDDHVPQGYATGEGFWTEHFESHVQPRRLKYRFGPETISRMLEARSSSEPPNDELSWFVDESASAAEYINGVISAADWDGIPWTVNDASVGFDDGPGVLPFEDGPCRWPGANCNSGPGPVEPPAQYRIVALHYLADRTFLGWNQIYHFAADENPQGYPVSLWEPGSLPAVRWHERDPAPEDPYGAEEVIASWKEFWTTFHSSIRDDYLGKQVYGDEGTLAPAGKVGFLPGGTAVYGVGAGDAAVYRRVYRFIRTPDSDDWRNDVPGRVPFAQNPGPEVIAPILSGNNPSAAWCTRALYRYPYRFTAGTGLTDHHFTYGAYDYATDASQQSPPGQVPLSEIMWWTVIDEFDSIAEVRDGFDEWKSRRIVGLNPAGRVLLDQRWRPGELGSSEGVPQKSYVYDAEGRLTQERSLGWAAAGAGGSQDTEGLITVYDYVDPVREDPNSEPPSTLVAQISIRKGSEGDEVILRQMGYDDEGNLNSETDLDYDAGVLAQREITTTYAEAAPGTEDEERVVSRRMTTRAAIQASPGGELLKPFEVEIFATAGADKGRLLWRVYGLLADPAAGPGFSPEEQVYIDYMSYDELGRTVFEVVDIDLSGEPGSGGEVPMQTSTLRIGTVSQADLAEPPQIPGETMALLAPYARRAPEASGPLNLVTYSTYNEFGRTMLVEPTGMRTLTTWKYDIHGIFQQLEASGVYFEGNDIRLRKGSRSIYAGFSVDEIESYDFDMSYGIGGIALTNPLADLLEDIVGESGIQLQHLTATLEPTYDSSGRVSGVEITSPDLPNDKLTSYVFKDGWGNVLRSENADGDITRHTYDWLGRLHKTFRGTSDTNPKWRGVDDASSDDMVMTERLFYGRSPSDAFQVTRKWMFNEISAAQYGLDWEELSDDPDGLLWNPGEGALSSPGTLEEYEYDWRMRRIATRYTDLNTPGAPYKREVTWLDNLDRVVLRAVYAGAAGPVGNIDPGGAVPSATTILSTHASGLLSLEETIYNAAGQVQETRRYDTAPGAAGQFLASASYADHDNRPVWTRSGSEITKNLYNARGQLIRSQRFAADGVGAGSTQIEIARTVNVYNESEGVAEQTYTWERQDPDSSFDDTPDLQTIAANTLPALAVTVTYNWYDSNKRVIATADFGRIVPTGAVTNIDAFRGNEAGLPARPGEVPERTFEEIRQTGSGDPAPLLTRWLSGYTYPPTSGTGWFDAAGRARANFTFFDYDANGNQRSTLRTLSCTTDGTDVAMSYETTWSSYSPFAQKVLELRFAYTKDAGGVTRLDPHGTAYAYEGSRVTQVATVLPSHFGEEFAPADVPMVNWSATDGSLQITRIEYGAPVISANYSPSLFIVAPNALSTRNDLVSAVFMPDPTTGQPSAEPAYRFFYRADGSLAGRVDARGVALEYAHDAQGNTTSINVQTVAGGMPTDGLLAGASFVAPVGHVAMTYDLLGRLLSATTYTRALGTQGDPTSTKGSEVTFEYDPWGNLQTETQHNTFGFWFNAPVRAVSYDWETGASTDGSGTNESRLLSITYPVRPPTIGTWDGAAAPTARTIEYDFGPPGSVDNLLGRVRSIASQGGPAASELGHVATYAYHGDARLVRTDVGERPCAGDPDPFNLAGVLREQREHDPFNRITLQRITNRACDQVWASDPIFEAAHGHDLAGRRLFTRLRQADFQTPSDRDNVRSLLYEYDTLGRLTGVQRGALNAANIAITDPFPRTIAYNLDRLGNRVGGAAGEPGFSEFFAGLDSDNDGTDDPPLAAYTVETDHRNRLETLSDDTGVQPTTIYTHDAAGNLTGDGRFLYHYDAFNRLVCVEDTQVVVDPQDPGSSQIVLTFAYDALGRLISRLTPWDLADTTETRIETYWYEGSRRIQDLVIDPYPAGIPWMGLEAPLPQAQVRMEHEYVYAAHPGAGVDDLHAVVDWFDRIAYPIRDASTGTLLAYTTDEGEVAEQYAWSPFGRLLDRDALPGPTDPPSYANGFNGGRYVNFNLRVGHHGLFTEPMAGAGQAFDPRALALRVGRPSIYHNRNRTYDPHLGRFLQHDPNGTGQTLAGLAFEGKLGWTPPSAFDHSAWFGDGGNLYAAYGHDPVNATDPSGLFFTLPGVLQTTGKRLAQAANAYDTGEEVYGLVSSLASGIGLQQALLGLAVDALFDKAGGKLFDAAIEGAQRVGRAVRKACNCVPAGTRIETSDGLVPIESIEPGDFVLSVDHLRPGSDPVWARVEAVAVRETEELVRLTLADGRELSLTDSHLIWVDQAGWIDAGDVLADDLIHTASDGPVRVARAERVAVQPTIAYTLQVDGTRTYYADGVWVHNSCQLNFAKLTGQKIGLPHSSKHLADNMSTMGRSRPGPATEWPAHHISGTIGSRFSEQKKIIERIMRRDGIDINEASNGVFIPATMHTRIHNTAYYNAVVSRLERAPEGQARAVLEQIGRELQNGTFPGIR
jgi:YD repeat-containing protein